MLRLDSLGKVIKLNLFVISFFLLGTQLLYPSVLQSKFVFNIGVDSSNQDVIRMAMFNKPTMIHPFFVRYSKSVLMSNLIFSQLFRLDYKGIYQKDLVAEFYCENDEKEYYLKLRDDAFFHDGVKVTAKDVFFTYKNYEKLRPDLLGSYESIEVIDNRSVVFKFKNNIKKDIFSFFTIGILPAHLLNESTVSGSDFFCL